MKICIYRVECALFHGPIERAVRASKTWFISEKHVYIILFSRKVMKIGGQKTEFQGALGAGDPNKSKKQSKTGQTNSDSGFRGPPNTDLLR